MTERLDPPETEDRADAQSAIEIALRVKSAVRKVLLLYENPFSARSLEMSRWEFQ